MLLEMHGHSTTVMVNCHFVLLLSPNHDAITRHTSSVCGSRFFAANNTVFSCVTQNVRYGNRQPAFWLLSVSLFTNAYFTNDKLILFIVRTVRDKIKNIFAGHLSTRNEFDIRTSFADVRSIRNSVFLYSYCV